MKLLIASHGTFAKGIKSALKIIVGNVDNITTINAYVDECDFKKELDTFFEVNKDEEIIVCTDLFGGSVNQAIIQKLKEKDFYISFLLPIQHLNLQVSYYRYYILIGYFQKVL